MVGAPNSKFQKTNKIQLTTSKLQRRERVSFVVLILISIWDFFFVIWNLTAQGLCLFCATRYLLCMFCETILGGTQRTTKTCLTAERVAQEMLCHCEAFFAEAISIFHNEIASPDKLHRDRNDSFSCAALTAVRNHSVKHIYRQTNLFLIGIGFFLLTNILTAQEFNFRDNSRLTALIDARSAYEFDSQSFQKLEVFIRPEFEIKFSRNIWFKSIGRIYSETLDKLEPGRPGQTSISNSSKRLLIGDRLEAELREFYFDIKIDKHYLTIGKQQIVWGKADGLKILDVVNPTNLREFLLDDFDNSRIPLWSVKADLNLNKIKAQIVWVPDLTYHDSPDVKGKFPFGANSFPPSQDDEIVIQNLPKKPNNIIEDSDIGLRLSAFLSGWDLTLNYLYNYDDFPVAVINKGKNTEGVSTLTITPEYKRHHLIGGTFSNSFGSYTLRGEVGYSVGKYFSTNDGKINNGIFKSDQIVGVVGVDYSGISNTLISGQVFEDYVFEDISIPGREQFETNVSFLINRTFENETIKAEAIVVHNINLGDGFIRPKIEYLYLSNLTISLGADIFYGNKKGLFGQFNDRSRFFLAVQLGI